MLSEGHDSTNVYALLPYAAINYSTVHQPYSCIISVLWSCNPAYVALSHFVSLTLFNMLLTFEGCDLASRVTLQYVHMDFASHI